MGCCFSIERKKQKKQIDSAPHDLFNKRLKYANITDVYPGEPIGTPKLNRTLEELIASREEQC